MRKSYVIFICTFDPFDRGFAKYTFNAICNEDHNLVLDDGVTRVFINTEGDRHRVSKELANLVDYISTGRISDDYTKQLDEEVNFLRNDTGKERDYMTYMQTIMEHEDIGYNKGRTDGIAQGVTQATRDFAIRMIKNKEPFEKVADYTNLTIEQIGELAASVSVVH